MKRFIYLLPVITCIVLLCCAQPALARLDFSAGRVLAGKYLGVAFDATGNKSAADMLKENNFKQVVQEVPNYDFTKETIWFKLELNNQSGFSPLVMEIENPLLAQAWLYEVNDSTGAPVLISKAGINYPLEKRLYRTADFIQDLNIPAHTSKTYLLRLQSAEQVILPVFVGGKDTMVENLNQRSILYGIHIGILLVMILYNFFIYLSVKDRSYLYYVFYILFIGLTQVTLTGYTLTYLLNGNAMLFNKAIVVFPALAGICALFFIRNFLHTDVYMPRVNRLLWIWVGAYAFAALMRIAGFDSISSRLIDITALTASVIVYYISINLSLKGHRSAVFFLVAWTIFIMGLLLYVFRNLGILPYNLFTNYTMHAGTALEVTLLSIALADKINTLRKEKEASQAAALFAAQENERIIKDQNTLLEARVNERTVELKKANGNLSEALSTLKEAQTQLVESEKMASLGQLTAGIAHEINNPINFVTSNVKPLKRDIAIIIEALNSFEQLALSQLSEAEKQQKVAQVKEEIEYDYLMEEINFLLKGISEGSERTAEIVKGLRIFSRVDEDDLKQVDIHEGINSSVIIVNTLLTDKIKVVKHYGELPPVECYAGKLNQVFLNIISNGIHAVQKHFGNAHGGTIDITTLTEGSDVVIKIKDNGTGMDEQTARKIFEPFFTTKGVGEGTGLGLSIVYNIIRKHNGTIHVNSSPGNGAEFVIRIPISQN